MSQHERMVLPVVRQVALFHTLDEMHLRKISALLQKCRYPKGNIIFAQGEPGDCLHIIAEGSVRISLLSPDGRELTICIYEPGTAFGEFSVLDGEPRSATATALETVTSFVLYRADLLGLLREDFTLVQRLLAMLTARLRYTTSYSEHLAFLSVPGRVAARLAQLARMKNVDGHSPLRLRLTQQNLADFAGTSREWVNHALGEFAEQGLIRRERGAIVVLDQEGLQRYVR
jgi:CRP/FNR family transcriptional regulator, cyclic AMP receptor protein